MRGGCFGTARTLGCLSMLIALVLPAMKFYASTVRGWQVLVLLPLVAGTWFGLAGLYVNIAAVTAFVALRRGNIGRGVLLAIVPAVPLAIWVATFSGIGVKFWAAGVTLLIVPCAYMYGWQR